MEEQQEEKSGDSDEPDNTVLELEVVSRSDVDPENVVTVDAGALPLQVTVDADFWPTFVIEWGGDPTDDEQSLVIAPPTSFDAGAHSVMWVDLVTEQVEVHFGERDGDTGYVGVVPWDSVVGDRIPLETEISAAPRIGRSCVHGISPLGTHCSTPAR